MSKDLRKLIEKFNKDFPGNKSFKKDQNIFDINLKTAEWSFSQRQIPFRSPMREFLHYEKLIKNDEVFWNMFGLLYNLTPIQRDFLFDIDDAINRGDRNKINLSRKINLCNVGNIIQSSRITGVRPTMKQDHSLRKIKNAIKNVKDGGELTVYRGFLVPEDSYVRIGKTKKNNEDAKKQDVGLGWSFSISEDVAQHHSVVNTSSAILLNLMREDLKSENLFGDTWNEFQDNLIGFDEQKRNYALLQSQTIAYWMSSHDGKQWMTNEQVEKWCGFNTRPCVAKYSVKKEKIITGFNLFLGDDFSGEEEIFIHPEDVELERYYFTSWEEQIKRMNNPPALPTSVGRASEEVREWMKNMMKKMEEEEDGGDYIDFGDYEKLFAPIKDQYLEQEEYYASLPKI